MTEKDYSGSPRKKDIEGVAGKITNEATPNAAACMACSDCPIHNCLTNCNTGSSCGQICNATCQSENVRALLIDLDEVHEDPVKLLQSIKKQLGNINEIVEDIKK